MLREETIGDVDGALAAIVPVRSGTLERQGVFDEDLRLKAFH